LKHDYQAAIEHVVEAVLADQHEECRADSDQRVGAESGALLPDLRLEPGNPTIADSRKPGPRRLGTQRTTAAIFNG
jgi:hypothetical protein